MLHKIFVAGLVTILAAAPAYAANSSKEEGIGVGVGAVVGGLAGGPIGVFIGAAVGAKLGDEFNERNTEIGQLSASLSGSESKVQKLERNIAALGGDLERLQAESRPELLALLKAGIEMDLLFRTDEYTLADTTDTRLKELARSLASMPDVQVRLDGFADERGDAGYNQQLSEKRAQHVMHALLANGVPAERISVKGHGESKAADDTSDSFAFERKVSLTLYVNDTPSFAANPE